MDSRSEPNPRNISCPLFPTYHQPYTLPSSASRQRCEASVGTPRFQQSLHLIVLHFQHNGYGSTKARHPSESPRLPSPTLSSRRSIQASRHEASPSKGARAPPATTLGDWGGKKTLAPHTEILESVPRLSLECSLSDPRRSLTLDVVLGPCTNSAGHSVLSTVTVRTFWEWRRLGKTLLVLTALQRYPQLPISSDVLCLEGHIIRYREISLQVVVTPGQSGRFPKVLLLPRVSEFVLVTTLHWNFHFPRLAVTMEDQWNCQSRPHDWVKCFS